MVLTLGEAIASKLLLESGRKAFGSYFASADLPRLSDQAG
jgi:hypothetical protein